MTEEVLNTGGAAVHVLDVSDLNRAQAKVIRWVVGSGLFVAFACGVWVTKLQAKNDAQDVLLARSEAHLAWSSEAVKQLDSMRIENRHTAQAVQELTVTVRELSRLLERRGVR